MKVDPVIAALRGDRAPQRQAQAAMKSACDAWRAEDGAADLLVELVEFGAGAPIEACPALEAAFAGQGAAEQSMMQLVRHFCAALAANPLGHPPFRHGFNGSAASLLLARSGRAQLLLQSREPGRHTYSSATFSDALRYDATLAGRAEATILRIAGPSHRVSFQEERVRLRPGARLALDCFSETLLVERVETRLVTLRLLRNSAEPQPGREYCRDSGRLLHQSAGELATSRREMMVALLGRMERADAAPVFARMALSEHDNGLRWQCLRESLALDTAEGFAALGAIARDVHDPLCLEAGNLRARLVETHPQLMQLEASRCPA